MRSAAAWLLLAASIQQGSSIEHALRHKTSEATEAVGPFFEISRGLKSLFKHKVEHAPTNSSNRLAIVISGLASRLVLTSTLERVVQPLSRSGYSVDCYISLVRAPGGVSYSYLGTSNPDVMNKTQDDLKLFLTKAISRAGGHLAHLVQREEPETLPRLPSDALHLEYMADYAPSKPGPKSLVGLSVLRRWSSSQELLREMMSRGVDYDYVLWEREDQYWFAPLALSNFRSAPKSYDVVYAKSCLDWGGINDKSLLMGWGAAKKLLAAYSSYWEHEEALKSRNAENFLAALARLRGLHVMKLDFEALPSSDATFLTGRGKKASLCIKSYYSCKEELPFGSPPFCPDGGANVMRHLGGSLQ